MTDILRWKDVKTRAPHRCLGCGKTYPAGSEMASAAYAGGGTAFGGHWCKTCEEYMLRYFKPGDETGEGEIYEGDPEGWEALKAEMEAHHE